MEPDSTARGTALAGEMNTTEATIAQATKPGLVLPRQRELLGAVLATVLAIWATSAPGFAEWESGSVTSTRFAGLTLPMAFIILLALLPAWLPFERVVTKGLQLFAWIGVGPGVRRPAGSAAGLRVRHFRRVAPLRDAAFRVHGCMAGTALGIVVAGSAQATLAAWLFGTRFEGGAAVLGAILGMLSGACAILAFVSLPWRAATWRIEGPVDGQAVMEVLQYGADLLFLTLAIYVFGYMIGWNAAPSLLVLPLITLGALTGYALPRLLWRERSGAPRGVWVVLLHPGDAGVKDAERALRQVDVLARTWVHGPVTVVSNASLAMGGEQLHAALALGRERSMFPRIEVELADWGMLLPPPERWRASPVRELHVPAHLMQPALERFAGAADLVVLVSRQLEPIHAWRKRFRHPRSVVAWDGDGTGPAGAIALDSLAEHLARRHADSPAATMVAAPPGPAGDPVPAPADAAVSTAADEPLHKEAPEPETDPAPMDKTSAQEDVMEPDAIMRRLSETCIMLGDESTIRGSGFVVARGFGATADHVLAHHVIGERIHLRVGWPETRSVIATIHRRDPVNDVALLRLQHCDDIAPLPIRTDAAPGDMWVTFGFRWSQGSGEPVDCAVTGSIEREAHGADPSRWMNLVSAEHVPSAGLAGMSGSPVVVDGALAAVIVGTTGRMGDPALLHVRASPIGNLVALLRPDATNSQSASSLPGN